MRIKSAKIVDNKSCNIKSTESKDKLEFLNNMFKISLKPQKQLT
jgi:hypothetical protein